MTFSYKNVYINNTSTVVGPYEKNGPLRDYFDRTYDDLYIGEKSFEKGEIKLVRDSIVILLKKMGITKYDIDLVLGSDLMNQITASTYGCYSVGKGFIGVYGACSGSVLELIIASNFIESKAINNALCVVSSHNMTSERQYRYPVEYGNIRKKSSTFTSTGAASCFLSREKSSVRVECATLGEIVDYSQNDPNDMGRVMAPSAISTLVKHFDETKRTPEYYDLILTGDLGIYGKEIVKDYLVDRYGITLNNYNDCGTILYDLDTDEINAGGSGVVCSPLVVYSYIFDMMKKKKLRRVLFLATGALFSPISIYQKENINSICHAVSLEVV